jgi:translation elongation factor EF-G
MRSRGGKVADIVILVVAADAGVQAQTKEAIFHAKASGGQIIVALNKVDLPASDPQKVKQQLATENILVEDWGGEIPVCEVSAKTGQGLENLLETILLISELQENKAVIYAADFNVAPTEIDIFRASGHEKAAGFTIEERNAFAKMLADCNLIDTYRTLYHMKREYTYFSNFARSRERNAGWRIDGFVVSNKLKKYIKKVDILNDYFGSDHCPVLLEIDI